MSRRKKDLRDFERIWRRREREERRRKRIAERKKGAREVNGDVPVGAM